MTIRPRSIYFALTLLCLFAFWEAPSLPFFVVDDGSYISSNMMVQRGLSFESISWAVRTLYYGNYCPLTWLSHMLDHELFGLDTRALHLVNLLVHICNVLLLFRFLKTLTKELLLSAITTCWFAVHPIHVEPVVWLSSRKDLLGAFFMLLSGNCYLAYVARPNLLRYLAFFTFFVLSILSKSALISFPILLLLIDYFPLQRLGLSQQSFRQRTQCYVEKVPLILVSIVLAWVTFQAQRSTGAVDIPDSSTLALRLCKIFGRFGWYLSQIVYPSNLYFPYPPIDWNTPRLVLSCAVFFMMSMLALLYHKKHPYLLLGWGWFVASLIPYVQFVRIGLQEVNDRWAYTPTLGILITFVFGLRSLSDWLKISSRIRTLGFLALSSILVLLSSRQVGLWKQSDGLLEQALKNNSQNALAHLYLGRLKLNQQKPKLALEHFSQAQKISPSGLAFERIDLALTALARRQELPLYLPTIPQGTSTSDLREFARMLRAIGVSKEASLAYSSKTSLNPLPQSVALLEKAHSLNPIDSTILTALANTELALHHAEKALEYLEIAAKIEPKNVDIQNELGLANYQLNRGELALSHFRQAIWLNPSRSDIYVNLGNQLLKLGKSSEALTACEYAIRIDDSAIAAQLLRGTILLGNSKIDQAIEAYDSVLKADPRNPDALNGRGVALFSKGDLPAALESLTRCLEVAPNLADVFENRGALFLKLGRKEEALSDLNRALELDSTLQGARILREGIIRESLKN